MPKKDPLNDDPLSNHERITKVETILDFEQAVKEFLDDANRTALILAGGKADRDVGGSLQYALNGVPEKDITRMHDKHERNVKTYRQLRAKLHEVAKERWPKKYRDEFLRGGKK